jgi:hypothetical protein
MPAAVTKSPSPERDAVATDPIDGRSTAAPGHGCDAIALPWYEAHEYAGMRTLMKDGANFMPSHDLWEKGARRAEQFFVSKGRATVRVYIHPNEFARWCRQHGHELDTRGRLAFGRWSAMREHGPIPTKHGA